MLEALSKGYDLRPIFDQMLGSVPFWALAFWALKRWLKKNEKSDAETKLAIAGLHEKLNRIEMRLVESGISDLKENIEKLKESRTRLEMNVDAIWRTVEREKRASDR